MARRKRRKYPSEINTRLIRINLLSYELLMGISKARDITVAEAFDLVINLKLRENRVTVSPHVQIPIAITTAYRAIPKIAMATNGSKAAAFGINPKGVKHE
ncbi:hypothetical protein ES705_47489 [subsurface metagenome]